MLETIRLLAWLFLFAGLPARALAETHSRPTSEDLVRGVEGTRKLAAVPKEKPVESTERKKPEHRTCSVCVYQDTFLYEKENKDIGEESCGLRPTAEACAKPIPKHPKECVWNGGLCKSSHRIACERWLKGRPSPAQAVDRDEIDKLKTFPSCRNIQVKDIGHGNSRRLPKTLARVMFATRRSGYQPTKYDLESDGCQNFRNLGEARDDMQALASHFLLTGEEASLTASQCDVYTRDYSDSSLDYGGSYYTFKATRGKISEDRPLPCQPGRRCGTRDDYGLCGTPNGSITRQVCCPGPDGILEWRVKVLSCTSG